MSQFLHVRIEFMSEETILKKKRRNEDLESPDGKSAPSLHRKKHDSKKSKSSWTFEVDYNDHFETPLLAYQDVVPFISLIPSFSTLVSKSTRLDQIVVYDPYFCQGKMVHNFFQLLKVIIFYCR